jgi:ABC-type antimicrobial peptide transport system permease subunit
MFSGPPAIGFDSCVNSGKPLTISPYGNNAGAVEEFRRGFWLVTRYIILAIVILASLIMMGNVGKIIADSRRETAVFRALGAKRFDVGQIYITYSMMLAGLLFASSAVIGTLAAAWLDSWLRPTMSVVAVLTYNAADTNKQFWLFGFDIRLFIAIFVLIVIAAFISTIIPLSGNLRRNPIKDMRDEG